MINTKFIENLGEASPYRICYNKNYTGLITVDKVNASGFIQIIIPFKFYSIEKTSIQYKCFDPGQEKLNYVVTEVFFNIVPGSDPVHNMYIAEETGDTTRMKKEFPMYSRMGESSSQYYFNCVFNNKTTSIGWEFMFAFGNTVTGELRVWMEISGQYFT